MKKALITGITGQDGSYLAEFLLDKGYDVHGTMRKLIDVSKLNSLGWTHKVEIEDGVQRLFEWYRESLK